MAPRGKALTLSVLIAGDGKGYSDAARGARGDTRGLGEEVDKVATKAALMWATYKGYGVLEDAADAAAGLIEEQGKVRDVFAQSQPEIRSWAEGTASSIGLSERAALEYAGTLGNLLQPMGLAREESATWSKELIELAADMAAFSNVPVEETLDAISSGLAGQSRPLRQYGVFLSDARMRQEAMNMGIYDGTGILDQNQKMLATHSIIMQDTGNQVGAVEREFDGLGQTMKRSEAEAENARATFGEALIPIFKAKAAAVGALADGYNSLPGPLQTTTSGLAASGIAVAAVALGVGFLGPALMRGSASMLAFGRSARTAALDLVVKRTAVQANTAAMMQAAPAQTGFIARMRTMGITAKSGGAALGLAAGAFTLWQMNQANARSGVEEWNAEAERMIELSRQQGDAIEDVFRSQYLADWAADNADALGEWGISLDELSEMLGSSEEAWNSWRDARIDALEGGDRADFQATIDAGGVGNAVAAETAAIDDLREKLDDLRKQSLDTAEAHAVLGDEADETTDSTKDLTEAIEDQETALDRLNKTVSDRLSQLQRERAAQRGVVDAHRDRQDALAEIADAERAAKGQSEEYASALGRIEDAQRGVADAQKGVVDAQRGVAAAHKGVEDAHHGVADALKGVEDAERSVADARKGVADALRGIADAVRGVRDAEQGVVDAQRGVVEAQQKVNEARRDAAQRIRDMTQASVDARLEEERANLTARQAQRAAETAARDPRKTDLEKEDAALKAREAIAAAGAATKDRATAEREAAEAVRAGVEGDQKVMEARKGVADATRRVVEANQSLLDAQRRVTDANEGLANAHRRVSDAGDGVTAAHRRVRDANDNLTEAQRRVTDSADAVRDAERGVEDAVRAVSEANTDAARVLDEAKARAVEAHQRHSDAVHAEAEAWQELGEAHGGPVAGVQAYREALARLAGDMDPNSPLRRELEALMADLFVVQGFLGGSIGQAATSIGSGVRGILAGLEDPRTQRQRVTDSTVNIITNQTIQGTSQQQRRAMADMARQQVAQLLRGGR